MLNVLNVLKRLLRGLRVHDNKETGHFKVLDTGVYMSQYIRRLFFITYRINGDEPQRLIKGGKPVSTMNMDNGTQKQTN